MGAIEDLMFTSIRHVLDYSFKLYFEVKRTELTLVYPGQIVLNGSQVHWTTVVEESIRDGALADYLASLESQLLETVELVKKSSPNFRVSLLVL